MEKLSNMKIPLNGRVIRICLYSNSALLVLLGILELFVSWFNLADIIFGAISITAAILGFPTAFIDKKKYTIVYVVIAVLMCLMYGFAIFMAVFLFSPSSVIGSSVNLFFWVGSTIISFLLWIQSSPDGEIYELV